MLQPVNDDYLWVSIRTAVMKRKQGPAEPAGSTEVRLAVPLTRAGEDLAGALISLCQDSQGILTPHRVPWNMELS